MKKLLALVLAMVMTLGLATVGASAAAYTDAADINYAEAVGVLSAIKVFDGQNGAFNPQGTLTREQGAKIIAYMILGKTGADSLTTAKSSFSDVAPERWSAGAIEYCVTAGIIGGAGKDANGNDVFNPEAALTGHAFAKMCLVALGYSAKYENFVGGDWAINVAKTALSAGLNDSLNIVMSDAVTREQAAQMAMNTLKGTMVEYENPINVKGSDGMEVTVNAKRSDVVDSANANNYITAGTGNNDFLMQFAERYYRSPKLTLDKNSSDDFGRPANAWSLGNAKIDSFAKTPTVTYTTGVTGAKIYADLGSNTIVNVATTTWKQNGASVYTAAGASTLTSAYTTGKAVGTGAGVKTEIYYSKEDGTLDIINVPTFVAKAVSAYNTSTNKVTVNIATAENVGGTLLANKVTSINGNDFPAVVGAAVDDVFYVTAKWVDNAWKLDSVEKIPASAMVPSVKVSSKSDSQFTANGTSYTVAKFMVDSNGVAKNGSDLTLQSVTYDLILDAYGNALLYKAQSGSKVNADKYVFVYDGDSATSGLVASKAKVIKMDGTNATINVNSVVYTTDVSATSSFAGVYKTIAATTANFWNNGYTDAGFTVQPGQLVAGCFYTYTVNDDNEYTLTYAATSAATTPANYTNAVATANGADNNTAFVIGALGGTTYSSYLGLANFPGATGVSNIYRAGKAVVMVDGTPGTTAGTKYAYFYAGPTENKDSATGSTYYSYTTFMDGAQQNDVAVSGSRGAGYASGLFRVSYDSKGRAVLDASTYAKTDALVYAITKAYDISASAGVLTVVSSVDGGVAADGTKTYAIGSNTKIYYVSTYNKADTVEIASPSSLYTLTAGNEYKVVLIVESASDFTLKEVWIMTNRGDKLDWA